MDLLPYTLQGFHPTEKQGYEFFAVLRRAEGDHATATRHSIDRAREVLRDWPAEAVFAQAHEAPELVALRRENADLLRAIQTMRESRFWKITAPARKVVDKLRA